MESSYSGGSSEAEDDNSLSLERKRELVYETFKSVHDARELLQSWTRKELIKLICFESGRERKYTSLPKSKMINKLLKLVSRNSITMNYQQSTKKENLRANTSTYEGSVCDNAFCIAPLSISEDNCKRCKYEEFEEPDTEDHDQERNLDELVDTNVPYRLKRKATESKLKNIGDKDAKTLRPKRKANTENTRGNNATPDQLLCENVACQAKLSMGDVYCKRCSCCVCCKFDENKDPSLWLVCSSDPPFTDESCGATCHLRCALKHEKSGILKKSACNEKLDGAFYCVFLWKGQLPIGVNLLFNLLFCSNIRRWCSIRHFWCLRKQLTTAISARRVDAMCERLFLSNKMLQGTEIYKDIGKTVSLAVAKLKKEVGPLDKVSAANARGIVNRLNCGPEVQKLCVSALKALDQILSCQLGTETMNAEPQHLGVIPSTECYFKACPFSKTSELGSWEAKCITQSPTRLSDPGLRKEPTRDLDSQKGSTNSSENNNMPPKNASVVSLPFMMSNSCALELLPNKPKKPDTPILVQRNGPEEQRYEYCVKVIRWLEYEGYMERELRVKFLTWFSVKATDQERRVVNTFIDVLLDDPASLVAQLVDAFMDGISGKEKPVDKRVFLAKFGIKGLLC